MDYNELMREVRQFMLENENPELAAKYQRYFKEGYDAYGIQQPRMNVLRDRLIDRHSEEMGLGGFLGLGDLLFQTGKYEEAGMAILLASKFHKEFDLAAFHHIGTWLEKWVLNWAHSDVICSELLAKFWQQGIIEFDDMKPWKESASKWQRRAVPVSLISVAKRADDPMSCLEMVRSMMNDDQREVQQGLGWFLREVWKRYPQQTEVFLMEYKDTAPRLIYQYATEKMTRENKERFRKKKRD